MELADPCESSCGKDDKLEEAVELLEEYWFFENLLDRRLNMVRSLSYPCPPSFNSNQIMAVQNNPDGEQQASSSLELLGEINGCVLRNLLRTPSLPPCIGRKKVSQEEEIDQQSNRLTRQLSLNPSDILLPRHNSKSTTQNLGNPRQRTRRESKVESTSKDNKSIPCLSKELNSKSYGHRKSWKSLRDLEFEEVQGFKDLGFVFDKEDLTPTVINIIPGLQGKRLDNLNEEKVRRPYLSEAWLVQRSAPPVPNWVDGRSVGDMKTQLKFWARAVASNMHQEC